MDAADLKIEFTKQVKDADEKIAAAEKQLIQLKEYKTKLLGGLETCELILQPVAEDAASLAAAEAGKAAEDGLQEPSTVPPEVPSTDS